MMTTHSVKVNESANQNAVESRFNRVLAGLIGFIARYGMLVFLAWQGAWITWLVAGYSADETLVFSRTMTNQGSEQRHSALSAMGVFGDTAKVLDASVQKVDAPETNLRLQLLGVVTAKQKQSSGAIVAEAGREGLYYRVGDNLPGNAELVEVYDDRILLRRAGLIETLKFEESKQNSGRQVAERVSTASARNSGGIRDAEQFLGEAQRRLSQDPAGALGSVGLSPVKQGESEGYVFNGNNPMLSQMNLKKGDIIRSVNGYPMGDVQKDRALLKEFYDQGTVMVEVERDGTFFSINYPLR